MNGFDGNPTLLRDRKFNFLNPKLGFSYTNRSTTYYTSFAVAHKEPNRDDFEAGVLQQPKQEVLYDFEAGFTTKLNQLKWGINLYYMNYKDQLVLTGKINDVGAYTRTNVPKSYRAGVEIEGTWQINKQWSSNGNISFSQNKIDQFTEYFDDYDNGGQVAIPHQNTDIAFSPNTTAAHAIQYQPNDKLQLVFNSKYVSNQYLDNTQNESRKLDAFFVNDLNVSYKLFKKKHTSALLQFYVLNVFDVQYEPNGYTYSYVWNNATVTSNNYFPMAGRYYLVSVKIDIK
jgi:iron complex outermembrane receptor protein